MVTPPALLRAKPLTTPGLQGKSWMYTINNYTPEIEDLVRKIDCQYNVFGREVGKECNTPHLQGCITFYNNTRFKAVQKLLPGAHLTRPKFLKRARKYCMKDGDFEEIDKRIPQGIYRMRSIISLSITT